MDHSVISSVFSVGNDVVNSDIFRESYNQTHHKVSTVGDHSFYVACASLKICNVLGHIGIHTNKKDMINAALCHDLGILGRYEKFSNNRETLVGHPRDSVSIAEDLLGKNDNSRVNDIIAHHMWPVTLELPHCREAFIITVADKYCAVMERVFKVRMPRREEENQN